MINLKEKLAGKFIVIDGPDGAGKSTQLKLLAEYLRQNGADVVTTRDPGGTAIGDKIRAILLDNNHSEMVNGCEILLFMASRTQLMGQVIGPALLKNKCVLCDRWVSSTIAYQVAEGKAGPDEISETYNIALKNTWPDLTIILDVPPEVGLGRLSDKPDRMESKGQEFHRKVRELFLQQARSRPKTYTIIETGQTIEQTQQKLRQTVIDWKF